MKKSLFLSGVVAVLMSFTIVESDGIVKALKQGNATELAKYFDNTIDLKLPEKEEFKNIGKNTAEEQLSDFFSAIRVKGFDVTSQREMGGTMYLAGKLKADSKDYNVTLMLRNKGERTSIITIRIN